MGDARRLRKPPGFPLPALDHVRRVLRPGGVAVCNTLDEAADVRGALAARFARLVRVEIDDYENQIFVASDGPLARGGAARARGAKPGARAVAGALSFRRVRTSARAATGSAHAVVGLDLLEARERSAQMALARGGVARGCGDLGALELGDAAPVRARAWRPRGRRPARALRGARRARRRRPAARSCQRAATIALAGLVPVVGEQRRRARRACRRAAASIARATAACARARRSLELRAERDLLRERVLEGVLG